MQAIVKATGESIDVYQECPAIWKPTEMFNHTEYEEEELEFPSNNKKRYIIELFGNGYSYSEKYLTDNEYELIKEIIDDLENEYESVVITKLPDNQEIYDTLGLATADKNITVSEIKDLMKQHIDISFEYMINNKIAHELKEMKMKMN